VFPDGPASSSHLVGQGDSCLVEPDALFESKRPALDSIQRFFGLGQGLGPAQRRSSAVDDQHSKVFVAALGDPPEPSSVATGALQGRDAQPGGEVTPGLEVIGRSRTGDQCGASQQPDAGDLLEQGDLLIVPRQGSDLALGDSDLVFQVGDFREQLGEDLTQAGREVVLIDELNGIPLGGRRPDGNDVTQLSETPAKPVNPGDACGFPLLTHSMELLNLLLIDRADRNGMDPAAAIGIDQGFGVGLIGLVAQPVLADELGREHDRFMPQFSGLAAPEMSATAGLEQHDARLHLDEKLLELPTTESLMRERFALASGESDLKNIFCEIDGDEIRLSHGLLLSWDIQRLTPECWHIAMPVKTREESISSLKFVPRFALHRTRLAPRRLA